ncbi:hypothetical protein MRB53_038624 [Persea americana]|nr:hypothetical protein MRB53_038624 [Persea americana]
MSRIQARTARINDDNAWSYRNAVLSLQYDHSTALRRDLRTFSRASRGNHDTMQKDEVNNLAGQLPQSFC